MKARGMFSEEIPNMPHVSNVEAYLWQELASEGKFELIDLLVKADKGEVHTVKLKEGKKFSSSEVIHKTVLKFLELRQVEIIS